jgi:hypothetical protein
MPRPSHNSTYCRLEVRTRRECFDDVKQVQIVSMERYVLEFVGVIPQRPSPHGLAPGCPMVRQVHAHFGELIGYRHGRLTYRRSAASARGRPKADRRRSSVATPCWAASAAIRPGSQPNAEAALKRVLNKIFKGGVVPAVLPKR